MTDMILLEANSRRHRRNEARAATDRLLTGKSPRDLRSDCRPALFRNLCARSRCPAGQSGTAKCIGNRRRQRGPYQGNGGQASSASAYCRNRS